MVRARELSGFHSACTCVFVCGLFLQLLCHQTPTGLILSEAADGPLSVVFSRTTFTRLFHFSDGFLTPGFLIGTCMKWASLRRLRIPFTVRSSLGHPLTASVGVHSFNLFTSFDHSFVTSMR